MLKSSKILIFLFVALFVSSGFNVSSSSAQETKETVYVCPEAISIKEVNPRCAGKIILKLGETIEGLTLTITNYEGRDYYLVLGFRNGGGAVNLPPIADANGPYEGYGGLPINFDASNSTDPNKDPLQYRWDFNNDEVWDTDWLTTSTVKHIWNEDYEGIVKLEVSDGEFNATTSTTIKIKSPKSFKQDALFELKTAKTGEKKANKKINQIIWFLNQSLDKNLWLDASHLISLTKGFENFEEKEFDKMFDKPKWTGPKPGIIVFYYERVAVRLMLNEIKFKKIPEELKSLFESVIAKLVKADKILAKVSIFEVKNNPIQNPKFEKTVKHQIELAEKELTKADQELEKGQPDKAISRLAKSWLRSQLAIKFANINN